MGASLRGRCLWPAFLSIFLCLWVYGPALDAPFVWDDIVYLSSNSGLRGPLDLLGPGYFTASKEASWRPLATLSYSLPLRLWGGGSAPFRMLGLALHLGNAFLLFLLVRRLGIAPRVGVWAAALFLLHPVHAETLMCVTFNEELLTALGILAMLHAHLAGRHAWAAAAFAFALLAKETGALGLVLAGCLSPKRSGKVFGSYGVVLSVYLYIRFLYLPGPGAGSGLSSALPFLERAFYGMCGLVTSFRLFFFPVGLRLEYFALPGAGALWTGGAIAVVLLCSWTFLRFREDKALMLFLIWPIVFFAITSNILPLNLLSLRYLAERWLYLPFLGMVVPLAVILAKRPRAGGALLLVWAALAGVRVGDWADEVRLWEKTAAVYPWSAKVQESLGEAYFKRGRYEMALRTFSKAHTLRQEKRDRVLAHYVPLSSGILRWESPSLYRWLGRAHLAGGDIDAADLYFSSALLLEPDNDYSYRIMAYHYALAHRFEEARRWQERGLERFPQDEVLRRLRQDIGDRRLSFRASF